VMKNVVIVLCLLLGTFVLARLLGADDSASGRLAIAAVFAFTALGHFIKTEEMAEMLPPSVPARRGLILISGFFEAVFATGVLFPRMAPFTGVAICLFLVMVAPLNVYAAVQRVDFGGHGNGPRYLWVRMPLQILLLVWTWWFTLRIRPSY
jgi:uncharacterized membrane protein